MKTTEIMVSAILITYNHEKYVREAIESIINQKTSFRFEILVGDDFSRDDTQLILKEYAERYPDLIHLRLGTQNVGANRNVYELYRRAKGKYITVLEGDDYWLGTDRLQKLVDFLENNTQYIGVGHKRERRDLNGLLLGYDPSDDVLNHDFTVKDFLKGKRFSLAGSMFKNVFIDSKDKYEVICEASRNVGDFFVCMILLDIDDYFIMDKPLSVYRVRLGAGETNYNAIMSPLDNYFDHINLIRYVDSFFRGKYRFLKECAGRQFDALLYCIKRKKGTAFKEVTRTIRFREWVYIVITSPVKIIKRLMEKH